MKKQIACPECKGKGYITVMTGDRNDYCGTNNITCQLCYGTGMQMADMTNGDRIRAMTDEELAWELMTWRTETAFRLQGVDSNYPYTQKTILEWLMQPAEEKEENK